MIEPRKGRRWWLVIVLLAVAACWWLWTATASSRELAKLHGVWEAEWSEYGGERSPAERDVQVWLINGGELTRYVDGFLLDVLRVQVRPAEQEMDLIPIGDPSGNPSAIVSPTACLYSLEDDRLQVAFTFEFVPGSPEQERKQAIEWGKVRPGSFQTTNGRVAVVNLKRVR
jgi:hypothetical protein